MKNVKWSIREGSKHVASGVLTAESDKDALGQVMLDHDGKLAPDKSYSFKAGELSTSSYGDELSRSARVTSHGMDEDSPMDGEHHFQPKLADVGILGESADRIIIDDPTPKDCPHNAIGILSGASEPICLHCGAPFNFDGTPRSKPKPSESFTKVYKKDREVIVKVPKGQVIKPFDHGSPTGRVSNSQPNLQPMPLPSVTNRKHAEKMARNVFNSAIQRQASTDIYDKYVREAAKGRAEYAQAHGIQVDQVQIDFNNDEITYSFKP